MTAPFEIRGLDYTAALRPAVYVLRDGRRVVWVGGAKVPASRIHAHLLHARGQPLRAGMPPRPVRFDSIELRPCRVEDLGAKLAETRVELNFTPEAADARAR